MDIANLKIGDYVLVNLYAEYYEEKCFQIAKIIDLNPDKCFSVTVEFLNPPIDTTSWKECYRPESMNVITEEEAMLWKLSN